MLLQIRRPRRPEPLPLRERDPADAGRDASVWISVRHKRERAAPAGRQGGRKISLTSRGPSAPAK